VDVASGNARKFPASPGARPWGDRSLVLARRVEHRPGQGKPNAQAEPPEGGRPEAFPSRPLVTTGRFNTVKNAEAAR